MERAQEVLLGDNRLYTVECVHGDTVWFIIDTDTWEKEGKIKPLREFCQKQNDNIHNKRYSECGIRIGALITKNEKVRNTVMKFCQARLSPPLIGQLIAEASIEGTEQYSRDVYDEYVERRKCLIDGVNRIPGCYTPVPRDRKCYHWGRFCLASFSKILSLGTVPFGSIFLW